MTSWNSINSRIISLVIKAILHTALFTFVQNFQRFALYISKIVIYLKNLKYTDRVYHCSL